MSPLPEHISNTEENYLKAIFKICERSDKPASTNAIARQMHTSAASVSDMIKRLSGKEYIQYEPYKGVVLSKKGKQVATLLIRKHRLWEVFLANHLHFTWDKIHEIAEQLEHIKSEELVERLDEYLNFPKFDPHGDPIPDANGNFTLRHQIQLSELSLRETGIIVGVQDHTVSFLQYLEKMSLVLGVEIKMMEKFEYDESVRILLSNKNEQILSKKVSSNIFVQRRE